MKALKISEGLLAKVLENDVDFGDYDSFKIIEIIGTQISISYCYPFYDNYNSDGSCDCSFKKSEGYINIYEFAFKCKEWAFQNGYTILIYKMKVSTGFWADIVKSITFKWEDLMFPNSKKLNLHTIYSQNELGVVFEACEWILTQKDM